MKLLLIAAFICFVSAESPRFERACRRDEITWKDNFNFQQYAGTWFEVERYKHADEALPEIDCVTQRYTMNSDGSAHVRYDGRFLDQDQFSHFEFTARISFPDEDNTRSKLNLTSHDDEEHEVQYWIVATDYYQYSIVWACEDFVEDGEPYSHEGMWILSRTPSLPNDPILLARIETVIDKHFSRDHLRWTEQTDAICLDRITPYSDKLIGEEN